MYINYTGTCICVCACESEGEYVKCNKKKVLNIYLKIYCLILPVIQNIN